MQRPSAPRPQHRPLVLTDVADNVYQCLKQQSEAVVPKELFDRAKDASADMRLWSKEDCAGRMAKLIGVSCRHHFDTAGNLHFKILEALPARGWTADIQFDEPG